MIKLVVFDWNGVLIADARACMESYNHILKTYKCKPINMSEFRGSFMIPARDFYLKHGLTETQLQHLTKRGFDIFYDFYEKRIKNMRTRRGARKLLSWLRRKNIELIILSNHTATGIQDQLERLNIRRYFEEVLASNPGVALVKRSKGGKLTAWMKKKKVKPSQIIIIGDSPEEIEIGKHLNIRTVGITGGYCSAGRLRDARPNYLVNNLSEMINIIKNV